MCSDSSSDEDGIISFTVIEGSLFGYICTLESTFNVRCAQIIAGNTKNSLHHTYW